MGWVILDEGGVVIVEEGIRGKIAGFVGEEVVLLSRVFKGLVRVRDAKGGRKEGSVGRCVDGEDRYFGFAFHG